MTENTSRTRELSIGEIVVNAHRLAGLLNISQGISAAQAAWGRTLLETTTKHLEAIGVQTKARSFVNIQLEAGTGEYDFPDTVLDVLGDGQYIPESEVDVDHANGETPIQVMDAATWHRLANKAAQGRPTKFYQNREGALIQAKYWPIPAESGTVRHMVQLLLPDSTDANSTPGLERPWAQYFQYELAWQLAESADKSADKIKRLREAAAGYLQNCRGFSNQHVPAQATLDHATGWSGYGWR